MTELNAAFAAADAWPQPDAYLSREELAKALGERGLPVTVSTLTTWASRGHGPPCVHWGRLARYRWRDALAWAMARIHGEGISSDDAEQP
jgi:hypothetical protein